MTFSVVTLHRRRGRRGGQRCDEIREVVEASEVVEYNIERGMYHKKNLNDAGVIDAD